MTIVRNLLVGTLVAACAITPALAEITAEQIARLGKDLTPLGGERAGNAEGTIPPWEGGLLTLPAGYKPGDHHPDPYSTDEVLFTISADNLSQYGSKVTPGHQAMIGTYDSFQMNVYPTRRSASVPQRIYDATREVAATAKLTADGSGVEGSLIGIPFPIPSNGQEAIWNHLLRYRGDAGERYFAQVTPTRGGRYTLVKFEEQYSIPYSHADITQETLNNNLAFFKQRVVAPARLSGGILLIHETLDQIKEPRNAWTYNPGQRRVRRAPNLAYDNPGTASDGLRTTDNFEMFSGAIDRYDWTLIGKQEFYLPYNSYQLHSDALEYDDIVTPLHINPDHVRYELHRVWVVDAKLKEGARHIYKRRTFYIDEDTWQILHVDQYDNRDQLWRVSDAYVINYYEVPMVWTTLEAHVDLQAGRYLAIGLNNESKMHDFGVKLSAGDFTPAALRREGIR